MEPVTLGSRRLVLDQPVERDVDTIAAYCIDPAFERYLTTPWPYERVHAEGFVSEFVPGGWATGREATWAIRNDADGPLLGVVGLRDERREIGFWLGAPHRGEGIMTEAVLAVLDWAFAGGWPDTETVTWCAVAGNVESAGVARAAAFVFSRAPGATVPARDGHVLLGWYAWRGRAADPKSRMTWAEVLP